MRRFSFFVLTVGLLATAYATTTSATLRELLNPAPDRVFLPVPIAKQSRNYTCGAAAVLSILSYYGEQFTEGQLQYLLGTAPDLGTSYRAIQKFVTSTLNDRNAKIKALCSYTPEEDPLVSADDRKNCPEEYLKGLVGPPVDFTPYALQTHEDLTEKQLEALLREGKPVLALIQAWPGMTDEAKWRDLDLYGHYVVVVGFDKNNFYLMDPVVGSSWSHLPRAEFVQRWHDVDPGDEKNKSRPLKHFGMTISRNTPRKFLDAPFPPTM